MDNRLHVYMGEGKGKTTAAMGLAVRSLGHGNRVLVGQFLKDGRSGELVSLAALGAKVMPAQPLSGFLSRMSEAARQEAAARQAVYAGRLTDEIRAYAPKTVILDELGMALHLGVISEEKGRELIACALDSGETVVTGRYAPEWLLAQADYVSRIVPEKHPYQTEGLKARKGVEW